MENLSESDANLLQSFGKGQGLVSGQAVRFPLLVKIDFDQDLISSAIGDEDFLKAAEEWRPTENHEAKKRASDTLRPIIEVEQAVAKTADGDHSQDADRPQKGSAAKVRRKKGKGIRAAGF
jgi:hypothetical protein